MKYLPLFLFALLLMGAGCVPAIRDGLTDTTNNTDTDIQPEYADCTQTTAHNSCIDSDGNDEALIGTWELETITVSGTVMSFTGHTLTFDWGSFETDYSTEEYTGATTPAGTCFFNGSTRGYHYADTQTDPATPLIVTSLLDISKTESEIGSSCAAAETITTQVTNMSLGTGTANPAAMIEGAVLYSYAMPDDWSALILTASHVPVTYMYTRVK